MLGELCPREIQTNVEKPSIIHQSPAWRTNDSVGRSYRAWLGFLQKHELSRSNHTTEKSRPIVDDGFS